MQKLIPTHKQVFYHSLVRWNVVDEIIFLTEPEEHQHSRRLILDTLDHAVLEAALAELSEEEHDAFLDMCKDKYHQEELLDWLSERVEGIHDKLRAAIQETKQEIRELLTEQRSLEDVV